MDEGFKMLDAKLKAEGNAYQIDTQELDGATGVGVVVSEEQIVAAIDALFAENAAGIEEEGHSFNFGKMLSTFTKSEGMKWADGAVVRRKVDEKKLATLGEPPAKEEGKREKKNKPKKEPKPAAAAAGGAAEETKEEEPEIDIGKLIGRDVDIGNTPEILGPI